MTAQTRAKTAQRIEDANVREKLQAMEQNPLLNVSPPSFSANVELYPDGQIPFVEKHIAYLLDHPAVNPDQYLSNLRLMLKKRS